MAATIPNNIPASGGSTRLSGLFGRVRALPAWLRRNPLRGGLAIGGVSLALIGAIAAWTLTHSAITKKTAHQSIDAALAALDAGDDAKARQLAAEVRSSRALSYEELGGPLYVLGVVMARDADQHLAIAEKQMLYALAARYFEESRSRGFPANRQGEGLWLLGSSLHHSGQIAKCIPILREALSNQSASKLEIHRLLADSYLQLSPPKLADALDHNRQFLAAPRLRSSDREAGILFEAEIYYVQDKRAECRATLERIPATSTLRGDALVLKARLLIREGDAARLPGGAGADEATAKYQEAKESLQGLVGQQDIAATTIGKAQLLLGLCSSRLDDNRAAVAQFDRVRRAYFGRPESLAATMFQADLQRQANRPDEAMTLYRRVIQEAGPREVYRNPWLSLTELENALQASVEDFLNKKDYARALDLAKAIPPLVPRARSLELEARIQLAWADDLDSQAVLEVKLPSTVLLAEARAHRREAGAALEGLAKLRFVTRYYTDDLAHSAQSYLDGHGYEQAVRVYRELLQQSVRAREPEALCGLGEALLSLGQTDAALAALHQCRDTFPKHPATYRARLLIAAALEEQGKLAEARQLLTDNLYNYALTPQSTEWQDSLFALGNLLYREGLELETKSRAAGVDDTDPIRKQAGLAILEQSYTTFFEAIRTLTEATERYPVSEQVHQARYRIAEAYRHRSKWSRKKLGVVTIETTRISLNRQIQQELQSALDEYSRLIELLGNEQETTGRSSMEQTILRNCYFGRADALFDLGRYEEAAGAYSAATNRYQHQPESLEAYVQIAACYRRLNRPGEARGTLEQARVVLQRLPADTDFTRTTRYDRNEWSQLLTWLASL